MDSYDHIPFVASIFAYYCCFTQLSFCFGYDYAFIWNILVGYATNLEDLLVATTFMAHLAPKTKVCQHILIWSSNDVVISLVARPKTSIGPKLCGNFFGLCDELFQLDEGFMFWKWQCIMKVWLCSPTSWQWNLFYYFLSNISWWEMVWVRCCGLGAIRCH
jgi:hypothetical protein